MIPYDHQTAFNKAAIALIEQNAFSLCDNGETCAYRDADGRKCAIGHLIPDELFDKVHEGLGVIDMLQAAPNIALLFAECEESFLLQLQEAHDSQHDPDGFAVSLLRLATVWHLDATVVQAHLTKGN